MKADKILIDTCIIIDFIKEKEEANKQLSKAERPCINHIIVMELLQGSKNKQELQKIKKTLKNFWLLPIHNQILNLSTQLIELYTLSHQLKIPDSIIAATSLIYNVPLLTYNLKDFKYIPNIQLIK